MFYVYEFFNSQGKLIYIGRTKDFGARMDAHRRSSHFAKEVKRIRVYQRKTKEEMNELERNLIRSKIPLYNLCAGQGKSFFKYSDTHHTLLVKNKVDQLKKHGKNMNEIAIIFGISPSYLYCIRHNTIKDVSHYVFKQIVNNTDSVLNKRYRIAS